MVIQIDMTPTHLVTWSADTSLSVGQPVEHVCPSSSFKGYGVFLALINGMVLPQFIKYENTIAINVSTN
jgi:hypothetical protein